MKKTALVVLSKGFEDVEAVAPIDILTRAGVAVTVASVTPGPVPAAYGLTLVPHTTVDQITDLFDAIVIPGGMVNAETLAANRVVVDLIKKHHAAGKLVAAICASSALVLGEAAGLLKGRKATGSPGSEDRLTASGATVTGVHVTVDGNIITGMGPGAALPFGLQIAECLIGRELPDDLAARWRIKR